LLVGGDGFLGRHVVEALGPARRITVLSRGHAEPLAGVETLRADRRDGAALARALSGRRFDFTVDLAAYDAAGVEALWRVPRASLGRYVMISTGQVYLVTVGAKAPFRESEFRHPLMKAPAEVSSDFAQWRYGVGKRRAEIALAAVRRHHGARSLALRLPVLQGAGDRTRRLWAWLERLLDGGPALLPDGGRRPTRFLEVTDAARAIARLADGPWPKRAAYNLAPERSTSLKRFLELAARAAGVEPRFVAVASAELERSGLSLDAFPFAGRWSSVLDARRARRELGFTASRPEDYLPRVVRAHLDHRPESHVGYAQREREREIAERQLA
jgi:nucleoside-diphosphate-sugar epimerase